MIPECDIKMIKLAAGRAKAAGETSMRIRATTLEAMGGKDLLDSVSKVNIDRTDRSFIDQLTATVDVNDLLLLLGKDATVTVEAETEPEAEADVEVDAETETDDQ